MWTVAVSLLAGLAAGLPRVWRIARRPCLAVLGRPLSDGDRERFARMADVQLEEWVGDGHFVHLVDVGRFATRLRQFVEYCTADD